MCARNAVRAATVQVSQLVPCTQQAEWDNRQAESCHTFICLRLSTPCQGSTKDAWCGTGAAVDQQLLRRCFGGMYELGWHPRLLCLHGRNTKQWLASSMLHQAAVAAVCGIASTGWLSHLSRWHLES